MLTFISEPISPHIFYGTTIRIIWHELNNCRQDGGSVILSSYSNSLSLSLFSFFDISLWMDRDREKIDKHIKKWNNKMLTINLEMSIVPSGSGISCLIKTSIQQTTTTKGTDNFRNRNTHKDTNRITFVILSFPHIGTFEYFWTDCSDELVETFSTFF